MHESDESIMHLKTMRSLLTFAPSVRSRGQNSQTDRLSSFDAGDGEWNF